MRSDFAAFLGSVVSTLVMHPIDTIKTRQVAVRAGRGEETCDRFKVAMLKGGATNGVQSYVAPSCELPAKAGVHASTPTEQSISDGLVVRLPSSTSSAGVETGPDVAAVAPDVTPEIAEPVLLAAPEELAPATASGVVSVAPAATEASAATHAASMAAVVERGDLRRLQGLLNLYQGLPGALFKEGPPSALYLGVYEARPLSAFRLPLTAALHSQDQITSHRTLGVHVQCHTAHPL